MPYSTSLFKPEIRRQIIESFPDRNTTILDIGAGSGTYHDLLGDYYHSIDAIEVWTRYVEEFGLKKKYRNVFEQDALRFFESNPDRQYEVAILGDVLEHFSEPDAAGLIDQCRRHCSYLLVVVPFECVQGEVDGNRYERHLQPDLGFETMHQRYGATLELLMHGFHRSDRDYEIAVYHSRSGPGRERGRR